MDNVISNDSAFYDVEKNKELFEYEMTEVLINFKDEFKKINIDDSSVDLSAFDVSEINLDLKNDDIEVAPVKMIGNIHTLKNVDEKCRIAPITVEKADIKVKDRIDPAGVCRISDAEVKVGSVKIPLVPDIHLEGFKAADAKSSENENAFVDVRFRFDTVNVDLSGFNEMSKGYDVTRSELLMPEIPEMTEIIMEDISAEEGKKIMPVKPPRFSVVFPKMNFEKKNINFNKADLSSIKRITIKTEISKEAFKPVKLPDFSKDIEDIYRSAVR